MAAALHAQPGAQQVERVDQDEGGRERAVGGVEVQLDGLVGVGIQRHEPRGGLRRGGIIQAACHQQDAAREELLLEPAPETHTQSVQRPRRILIGYRSFNRHRWKR